MLIFRVNSLFFREMDGFPNWKNKVEDFIFHVYKYTATKLFLIFLKDFMRVVICWLYAIESFIPKELLLRIILFENE